MQSQDRSNKDKAESLTEDQSHLDPEDRLLEEDKEELLLQYDNLIEKDPVHPEKN